MSAVEYVCSVTGFRMVTPTVFELRFETHQPMSFVAGQFISIVIPGAGPKGRDLRRAYSIASNPETWPIELCIKLVDDGPGTNYLNQCREGKIFKGFAPYGTFVFVTPPERHACFIATGTGVAPFRAIATSKAYQAKPPKSATCIFGVRTESELLYPELRSLSGLKFIEAASRPDGDWKGFKGRVTDYMRNLSSDFPWLETDYYLCGNGDMIVEVTALLTEKGVGKEHIHKEKYY